MGERIDLNRVAMFVQIAEAGGVTAAATKMKMPKSSVSRGLTQLEGELGVELVVRGSRTFRLSEAGRAFFEAASKGITALEIAKSDVRDELTVPRGVVRIAAPATHATLLVAPAIARFVRAHPGVRVELSVRGQAEAIREGFDLALHVGKLADSSLIVRRLGTVDLGVFGSTTYLRERGVPRLPRDLVAHECILDRTTSSTARWALVNAGGTTTVMVKGHIQVDDLFTAIATAKAHGGLAVLPIHHPESELVRVLPDHVIRGEPLSLVYPASRHTPLRVSLLCDAIANATSACSGGGEKKIVAA